MTDALNIEYLKEYLQNGDDVTDRYLLEKVKVAKGQVQDGSVDPVTARAVVEYVGELDIAGEDTHQAAEELARITEGGNSGENRAELEAQTRELLKQMEAAAIREAQ